MNKLTALLSPLRDDLHRPPPEVGEGKGTFKACSGVVVLDDKDITKATVEVSFDIATR